MITFPEINNVYLMPNPNGRLFPDICLRLTKINWIENEYEKKLASIEIETALCENKGLINDPELFLLLLKPYSLNHLILSAMGFSKVGNSYRKYIKNKSGNFVIVELLQDNGSYKLNDVEFDENKKNRLTNIYSLDELQVQVRHCLKTELPINIITCNHAICLLFSMNDYINAIYKAMLCNNMRCYYKWLPNILRDNACFAMPDDDVSLIAGYLIEQNFFEISRDEMGEPYLSIRKPINNIFAVEATNDDADVLFEKK